MTDDSRHAPRTSRSAKSARFWHGEKHKRDCYMYFAGLTEIIYMYICTCRDPY